VAEGAPRYGAAAAMKLSIRDVVAHQGRDWIVEGIAAFKVAGNVYPLARVVDGQDVRYVEPLLNDIDDRVLMLEAINDLQVSAPPPDSLSYKGQSFLPRAAGAAVVAVEGKMPDRKTGECQLWRYRAAGDLFIQIEQWDGKLIVLAGESVHKGMVDVLPGG